jgi:signal transduction histidine kinase
MATLAVSVIALRIGLYFEQNWEYIDGGAIVLVALLCLMGATGGNYLGMRFSSKSLHSIQGVEQALIDLADSRDYARLREQIAAIDQPNSLTEAFNSLVDRLEEGERQHLEFMSKVSHDLRSPLAAILGYAELLAEPELRHSESYLDKTHAVITSQGFFISNFIEEVLSAVEAEANLQPARMSEFCLSPLVDQTVKDIKKKTGREIVFENQAGDVVLVGDALGLREVLIHLIDNGVKFSGPDKPVAVGLQAGKEPGWIDIQVRDSGIGIDEDELATLFRRFGRVKSPSTQAIPGVGLGLYIARNIIKNHKGEITIKSQPGVGSVFTVHLPLSQKGSSNGSSGNGHDLRLDH